MSIERLKQGLSREKRREKVKKSIWVLLAIGGWGLLILTNKTEEPKRADLINSTKSAVTAPGGAVFPATAGGREDNGWDCAVIGPEIPNAFRAIETAGNPKEWELPPYLFIDGNGSELVVDSRSELKIVHNGDQICVKPR